MYKVVLLRHGQSQWNLENRFTGWHDVDLTEQGQAEARAAGQVLKENGFVFDKAYSSLLKRAIRTLWLALACQQKRAQCAGCKSWNRNLPP